MKQEGYLFGATTLSITMKCDTQHNDTHSVMLSIVYADCHLCSSVTNKHSMLCDIMLSDIMLSDIMLSDIMLSDIMLSVVPLPEPPI